MKRDEVERKIIRKGLVRGLWLGVVLRGVDVIVGINCLI
jgi:hypothetical protein